jgi:predicted RNA polymerase sigma factor
VLRHCRRCRTPTPVDVDATCPTSARLVFLCCHPALALDAQVALTLRVVNGLSTASIARAFLVPETTMAQRLVRAKRKVEAAHIRSVLTHTGGRMGEAADILGVHRNTITAKVREHAIDVQTLPGPRATRTE